MRAVYAGSFDPFTNGHYYVAIEAEKLFNELHIVIARNPLKRRRFQEEHMKKLIETIVIGTKIKVVTCDGFVADYCKENGIDYIVRGLRNMTDFLYEEQIAKINVEINPDIKTIYLGAENNIISSSMVSEMLRCGKDISKYVPYDQNNLKGMIV